jgi:hypothetical protein
METTSLRCSFVFQLVVLCVGFCLPCFLHALALMQLLHNGGLWLVLCMVLMKDAISCASNFSLAKLYIVVNDA